MGSIEAVSNSAWRRGGGILSLAAFIAFLAFAGPQDWRPNKRPADSGVIVVVRSSGPEIQAADFKPWLGNADAYKELNDFLHREPASGSDWRNALGALAVIAGGDEQLGLETLKNLESFAKDTRYFSSQEKLPGAPTIREAAAAAKVEVPFAVAMLVTSSMRSGISNSSLKKRAFHFLDKASNSPEQLGIEWTTEVFGVSKDAFVTRNQLFKQRAEEALSLLKSAKHP